MKIAIIADDLTGAAEFNGIALRYGCTTYLGLGTNFKASADVIVMSTDSRSMSLSNALHATEEATIAVKDLQADMFIKKIDSVLRGYVLDELKLQMKLLGKRRAIILPANPNMGRTIEFGSYYIHGTPIHETAFSHDPDFPATDSSVKTLLRCTDNDNVLILDSTDEIPDKGIFVGNVRSEDDLQRWVHKISSDMLVACGGDLFVAFMELHKIKKQQVLHELKQPLLYVCGTTFSKSVSFVHEAAQRTKNVFYIPVDFFSKENYDLDSWIMDVKASLINEGRAIVAIDPNQDIPSSISPSMLRKSTGNIIQKVLSLVSISSLFIEGGSSAAAILYELNISSLTPMQEIGRGVVAFQPYDLPFTITVKPGSYELPLTLKDIFLPS